MHETSPSYESKDLGHLGLVAGMCYELGISRVISQAIPTNGRLISHGESVMAMILNGLGFVNQRLYLTPYFFQNKPLEQLFKTVIPTASQLNESTLGRTLDAIYNYGIESLYLQCALSARQALKLSSKLGHLDSSSISVHGQYNSQEEVEAGVIHITQGYSKDHRCDLNQFVINLLVESQASIPLLMQSASGNQSDPPAFAQIIDEHIHSLKEGMQLEAIVCDAALYSEANLQKIGHQITFITRVPATLSGMKKLYRHFPKTELIAIDENYSYTVLGSIYGGVPQRWILVHSQAAFQKEALTLNRQDLKNGKEELKALKKLKAKEFACLEDAKQALQVFQSQLKILELTEISFKALPHYSRPGKPKAEAIPEQITYQIHAEVSSSLEKRQKRLTEKGWFLLATNHLEEDKLSPEEILRDYKDQQKVERGFRFLKSSEFLADSVFLEKPQRVMALSMIMTLCLLVYAALEFRVREGLKKQNQSVPDQKGKPSQKPTARWVFHLFIGVHILYQQSRKVAILNLKEAHLIIIKLLGYQYHYS